MKSVSENVKRIVQDIKTLSVRELIELIEELQSVFGVDISKLSLQNLVNNGNSNLNVGTSSAAKTKESTSSLKLIINKMPQDMGNRFKIIKILSDVWKQDMLASKKKIDSLPCVVLESAKKIELEEIKKRFENISGIEVVIE